MNTHELLKEIGLNDDEALVYENLLDSGLLPARVISQKTNIGRTLVYRNLARLQELGLVEKRERAKGIMLFSPTHPSNLNALITKKEAALQTTKNSLTHVLGTLNANYNALVGKPNVKFYEGTEGLERLYDDIIEEKQDLFLMRSPLDKSSSQLETLVHQQIKRQARHNIRVKALTPFVNTTASGLREKEDKPLRMARCIIPKGFDLPAQILIYGNKVGIVSLKKSTMTTIIENNDISETFKILFEKIWELATPESDAIKEKIELNQL